MDDAISRQAAIDALSGVAREKFNLSDGFKYYLNGLIDGEVAIRALPSAQPQREKGTWTNDASCPFCGFKPWYERDIHTLSFCPNCGAKMDGEPDEA